MYSLASIWSLTDIAARLMDTIAINETRRCGAYLFKRRRWGRGWLIRLGNGFLRLSQSHITMFPNAQAWQQREYASYHLLYGGGCTCVGHHTIRVKPLPGRSLLAHLQAGSLTSAMFVAAAHEFRRAHSLDNWSHGDPHLENVLYDGERAWLVDFETQHDEVFSVAERHADDLLVFLLDLIGRDRTDQWQAWSHVFLTIYAEPNIWRLLQQRLHLPNGLEAILWKSRTHYLPRPILTQRLDTLRNLIGGL